jgi:sterol desaturase/sphingolipid hydroxylase (fatty acid hydroxylase superfamily)
LELIEFQAQGAIEMPPVDWLDREPVIRLVAFVVGFGLIALWELRAPRRRLGVGRAARWPGNLGLVVVDAALVRLAVPLTTVAAAALAASRSWGLLHAAGGLPGWLATLVAVVLMDLAIYLQHVMFHAVPLLWRVHRTHHADLDLDVTTGVRFHPIEVLLSLGIRLAVVAAIGPPPEAVVLFELGLNLSSMWSHGNLRLPGALDRGLRAAVVTPDMHRVHHSLLLPERNANFGFMLSWWDHLCGTYHAQPRDGHQAMAIGIPDFREPAWLRLDRLLIQPFVGESPGPAAPAGPRRA